MTDSLITLRRAAFGYDKLILRDVDLSIERATFVGILGPNGSGKTTLARGVLGLLKPVAGSVEHGDVRLGYVPQRETLDPVYPLTVEEVVRMGAFRRLPRLRFPQEERAFVQEVLERVQLGARHRELFGSLSGGQRQRTLIARALVARPNVMVLDEPTSGVDQPSQELVLELLGELRAEAHMAIVIVSHQFAMTRTVDEVLWVDKGRVEHLAGEVASEPARLQELFARGGGGEL